MIEMTKIIKA